MLIVLNLASTLSDRHLLEDYLLNGVLSSNTAASNDYFHCGLICRLFSCLIDYLFGKKKKEEV